MSHRSQRVGPSVSMVFRLWGPRRAMLFMLGAIGLAGLASTAEAHGGGFRGPNLPPPAPTTPGGGAADKGGPSASGGGLWRNSDPASWSQWWALDRDRYLRQAGESGGATRFPVTGVGLAKQPATKGRAWEARVREEAVPELIRIVRKEMDKDMLTAAVMALAKMGLEPADVDGEPAEISTLQAIEGLLDHGNQEVAESAVLAIGVLGNQAAAPRLADILRAKPRSLGSRRKVSRRSQAFAAYGLGVIGRRATAEAVRSFCVHHLAGQLAGSKDVDLDLGVACVISLGLIRLEVSGAQPGGGDAIASPGSSREGQVIFLMDLLRERRLEDRIMAYLPMALARLVDDVGSLRDPLIADLTSRLQPKSKEAPEIRVGCVHALGALVRADPTALDIAARERLLGIAKDGDRLERVLALAALGRIGGRSSDPLGEIPRKLRSFLLERLSKGQNYETPWAALGVGLMENARARARMPAALGTLAALRHALDKAANPDEVGSLCIALALAGDHEAIPLILKRAQGGDETARGHAVTALGLLHADEAGGLLREMAAEGKRPALAREAAIALALIGDKEIQPILAQRAFKARFLVQQVSALLSLAYVSHVFETDPFIKVLKGRRQEETARAYAAVGLGIVADKDIIPWNHPIAADVGWWKAPETLLDPITGRGVVDLF